MKNVHRGFFTPINAEKYAGNVSSIIYRSGMELTFMRMCDENSAVVIWSSEPFRIPYQHPVTGDHTMYVPDFILTYLNETKLQVTELVEVKPAKESYPNLAKTDKDKIALAINTAKWQAAQSFASSNGIKFRVVTEKEIYGKINR